MIHVLAIITAQPGRREALLDLFRANVPNVLAEDGCIEYAAAIDTEPTLASQTAYGPDTFVVVEKWADLDALQRHFKAPHMAAYAEKTRDLVASRAIHILTPA